ncbi:MAG: PEP/pyruvate-binding domain-containing protein [Gammaproteobacteria bacterium]|nr:PEP/pyruvate-binding domain-containing protein [Gammaproteobacteria bacterium]
MRHPFALLVLALVVSSVPVLAATPGKAPALPPEQARQWVQEMKAAYRGPFKRIRWFCNDGSVLPPKAYACSERGGGHQHGEWSDRARQLRESGYLIASFLAGIEPDGFLNQPDAMDRLAQILLEQFLIRQDDGWILRKARFYRGAYQSEDEADGARALLLAMLAGTRSQSRQYLLLRTSARLLPWQQDNASFFQVRQDSSALAAKVPDFLELKNKIHNRPDAGDADRVRRFAQGIQDPELAGRFEALAKAIDEVYRSDQLPDALNALKKRVAADSALGKQLSAAGSELSQPDAFARYQASARLLAALRDAMPGLKPAARLDALRLSLEVELTQFRASTELEDRFAELSRRERLAFMESGLTALYGVGLLSARELTAARVELQALRGGTVPAGTYKQVLDYLGRVPAWGSRWLSFHFGEVVDRWRDMEPLVDLFTQDQLRGSPLLAYSKVLDGLLVDANQVLGVQHQLFGRTRGGGLRALNPGLARGTLSELDKDAEPAEDGIYLLPHTLAELTPVAGILTAGEGNPLSHVQLLARNLGIPNVAVDESLLPEVRSHVGKPVLLAVSAAGVVRLTEDRGQLDAVLQKQQDTQDVLIRPDLDKLDLSERGLLDLAELRASDSGRVVGPKSAKLGELKHHYPEAVADGVAIPFGIFREMLNQPMPGEGKPVFEWMRGEYRRLESLPPGSKRRAQETDAFRQRLQTWVRNADPGEAFRSALRDKLEAVFGADGSYGVFIRSDTNVEDLPGFTGAGLNLTLPNVVGVEDIIRGVSLVWASPFSRRAFAWRQAHMDQPEHVYPAVLLLESVSSEKSGVLVTQDIDSGEAGWLSVAVQEGVGGAVDGDAAESLRIATDTGQVRLLAEATAPKRRILSSEGGVKSVPVSDAEQVLTDQEVGQLAELARQLPSRFPPIEDAEGRRAPADIEFGFEAGELRLYQLRPFLESRQARRSQYLQSLDKDLSRSRDKPVNLAAMPAAGGAP